MYDQVVHCQRAGLCLSEHFLILHCKLDYTSCSAATAELMLRSEKPNYRRPATLVQHTLRTKHVHSGTVHTLNRPYTSFIPHLPLQACGRQLIW